MTAQAPGPVATDRDQRGQLVAFPRFDPEANASDKLAPRCGCPRDPDLEVWQLREWHVTSGRLEYSMHVECCRCGASWTWGQPGGAPPDPGLAQTQQQPLIATEGL